MSTQPTLTLSKALEEFNRLYRERLKVECDDWVSRFGTPESTKLFDQIYISAFHAVRRDNPELAETLAYLGGGSYRFTISIDASLESKVKPTSPHRSLR